MRLASGLLLLAGISSACSRAPQEVSASPFGVFRQPSITLTKLESPMPAPLAVGSMVSSATLTSDDPGIVSVDSSGALVAHRNGKTNIRTRNGAILVATVRALTSLDVVPSHVELVANGQQTVRVVGDGRDLSSDVFTWQTTDPNIAAGFGTTIKAGLHLGTATLIARSGDRQAMLDVAVRAPTGPFHLAMSSARVRVGDSVKLVVEPDPGPAEWDSTHPEVLQPLTAGMFLAKAQGLAEVCASFAGRKTCQQMHVVR